MSETTAISWTDHTFNPWSGCAKVSPACAHCYAAALPPSMRRGAAWGPSAERIPASDAYWRTPLTWNRLAEKTGVPELVFCASVADVFEDRADLDPWRERLWALIAETPHLRWLLLTKRPERMALWALAHRWPSNAWAGVTVEDQQRAEERIPWLLHVPAHVRFLSVEPMLGPIDLSAIPTPRGVPWDWHTSLAGQIAPAAAVDALVGFSVGDRRRFGGLACIDWVIAGGESGHHARPSHPDWFRSLRDQCRAAGAVFHFKQWGEWAPQSVSSWVDSQIDSGHSIAEWTGDRWLDEHRNVWSMFRVGKHDAGRLLDGVFHDARPLP